MLFGQYIVRSIRRQKSKIIKDRMMKQTYPARHFQLLAGRSPRIALPADAFPGFQEIITPKSAIRHNPYAFRPQPFNQTTYLRIFHGTQCLLTDLPALIAAPCVPQRRRHTQCPRNIDLKGWKQLSHIRSFYLKINTSALCPIPRVAKKIKEWQVF